MDPHSRRGPAGAGITVTIAEPKWRRLVPKAEAIAASAGRVARPAGVQLSVVLSSDRIVQQLNAAHRGRNKPTNVLTYEPPGPGLPGEIVLALGTVVREAQAEGRRPGAHLAHLVVHGALHLAGHEHSRPSDARRMEMAEARLLHRLRVPNPWQRR
ncbi:MAG: rRNA maturation RNase YbeY [Acetobacteraceae bacterium]|nr:rRNA maturation RNase YbeY [Acetobacteraceae bacterium]MBV8520917.1 rRNA maturation RNase YbeY [Acetobacteraceae bacterium]